MIEILKYEVANKNKVIGFVDIRLPKWKMIIRRIAHLQNGEKRWFNLPSFKKPKPDGKDEYVRYWQFELDAHNTQLFEALGEAVKKYCEENHINPSSPVDFDKRPDEVFDELPF